MVQISPDVKRSIDRFLALLSGKAMPRNQFERRLQEERTFDPSSEQADRYGGFQLTPAELEDAVKQYRKWLDTVRSEISVTKNEIRSLNEERKKLEDAGYEEEARDILFDIQLEGDKLVELQDERDEVEAKLQNLKRELNEVNRSERRRQRQERDPIDWLDYDKTQQEETRREFRKKRQQEQQAVRHHRRQLDRVRDTESADLSFAKELLGEEEAEELREAMNDDWTESDNDWLNQSQNGDEEDDTWPELN